MIHPHLSSNYWAYLAFNWISEASTHIPVVFSHAIFNLIRVFATSVGIVLYQIKYMYHESTSGHDQLDLCNVNSHLYVASMILVVVWKKIQHPHIWLYLINLGKNANDQLLSASTKSLWYSSRSYLNFDVLESNKRSIWTLHLVTVN